MVERLRQERLEREARERVRQTAVVAAAAGGAPGGGRRYHGGFGFGGR